MKLLPDQALTPFGWTSYGVDVNPVLASQQLDVGIGRHLAKCLGHTLRALYVCVAPPERRLGAPECRQPAVVAQHLPYLGVHGALDAVVRGGQRALRRQLRVQVGEKGPGVDQDNEAPAGPPQPLVREGHAPVDHAALLQEVGPEPAPVQQPLRPPFRLAQVPNMQQLAGEAVELAVRLQPRTRRCVPSDLAECMERASLHPRPRPFLGHRRGEAAAAVGHNHVGRGDAGEQRPPRAPRLRAGKVPRQHELVAAGYQHHAVAGYPYPVDEDDAVRLVDDVGHGPDLPEPCRSPPEGAPAAGHVGLGAL